MSYNKATLNLKEDDSKIGLIAYLPFEADKETFQMYQKKYPEMLIYCHEAKKEMTTNIPIKDLEFVCYNDGLSIGKRDE